MAKKKAAKALKDRLNKAVDNGELLTSEGRSLRRFYTIRYLGDNDEWVDFGYEYVNCKEAVIDAQDMSNEYGWDDWRIFVLERTTDRRVPGNEISDVIHELDVDNAA